MSTGFQIQGMEDVLKRISDTYSGTKAKRIRKEALNAGGDIVVERLKENFESFRDIGYSKDEIVRTNARSKGDIEELKVGWNGEHGRWRIVHLNEFGYSKNGKQYTPKGFGTIARTVNETQRDYADTVAGKLKSGL